MRISIWPVGTEDNACYEFRQHFPGRAIQDAGLAEVVEDWKGPEVLWSRQWSGDYPPADVEVVGVKSYDADVIILQRPALRHRVDLIPYLQAQGIRVVVDVDDRFDAIPRQSVAWGAYRSKATSAANIDRACQLADVVTCSTPALVKRYGYGKGRLLRNLVPAHYLSISVDKIERSVGWAGAVGTHPGDLESTGKGVTRALRASGWSFYVAGPQEGVQRALGLSEPPHAFGWTAFSEYPKVMAQFEVGTVPLVPSDFNYAKSWLKFSEWASLGVPAVASPTPENQELNRSGVGVLAGSPSSWERRLRQLFRSQEHRADLAGRGREAMARFTYEQHADRWVQAWTAACRQEVA